MQVSPFHSQRQLVSGKVGWGWRQATYPISVNFGFAGFLMLLVAISLLMRIGDPIFLAIGACLLILGLLIGIYAAKSVVDVCRQNSEYTFSQWQLIGIASYFLALIVLLSSSAENFAKGIIGAWWILPAAIFAGLSLSLIMRSSKSKSAALAPKQNSLKNSQPNPETISADTLNVVTYSDQTVFVSPSSLGQQPRQFNSLVLMALGFFFWTMLDFSVSIRAIAAIAFATTGLTGFFTWQAQLRVPDQILHLRFSGLWEMAAEYAIDLRQFSQVAVVKLQEANGELIWMQLSGNKSEITLPLAMTMLNSQAKDDSYNDQLGQILREEFHLAKQETERDSLGLANVLLPQGAGILAGTAFIAVGGLILFLFPLPNKLSIASAIDLLGVCIVSPAIARFFLELVATNSLHRDRPSLLNKHLQPWEIGTALLLMSTFFATQSSTKFEYLFSLNQVLPLITLIAGWLSFSIGVCILAFVRRTPLWNNNY